MNQANRVLLRTLGTKRIPDEELQGIAVPVALIWGRQDRVMKFKIAERASKKFGWPLYPIANAGHIPMAGTTRGIRHCCAADPQGLSSDLKR